jgi:hypothetical protein
MARSSISIESLIVSARLFLSRPLLGGSCSTAWPPPWGWVLFLWTRSVFVETLQSFPVLIFYLHWWPFFPVLCECRILSPLAFPDHLFSLLAAVGKPGWWPAGWRQPLFRGRRCPDHALLFKIWDRHSGKVACKLISKSAKPILACRKQVLFLVQV